MTSCPRFRRRRDVGGSEEPAHEDHLNHRRGHDDDTLGYGPILHVAVVVPDEIPVPHDVEP